MRARGRFALAAVLLPPGCRKPDDWRQQLSLFWESHVLARERRRDGAGGGRGLGEAAT